MLLTLGEIYYFATRYVDVSGHQDEPTLVWVNKSFILGPIAKIPFSELPPLVGWLASNTTHHFVAELLSFHTAWWGSRYINSLLVRGMWPNATHSSVNFLYCSSSAAFCPNRPSNYARRCLATELQNRLLVSHGCFII